MGKLTAWDGLCPAGKHGLDFEGQRCDLCKGLTAKQREAFESAFKGRACEEGVPCEFENEVSTPRIGKQLAEIGIINRVRLSHFPFHIQWQLTDAGRAVLVKP